MGIAEVADDLYGLPPGDFTAARNARAKEARDAGDRELAAAVTALRKPTAGAWLLNQLVRRHPGEVDAVLALGIRLRAAQGTLGAADLRALDVQRRQLTRAVAQQAVAIGVAAGRKVSPQVAADVEESLRSAMVDPDAGGALASGRLTDTFSASGLEPVDLSRVVALGARSAPVPVAPTGPDPRAVADARRAVETAERALLAARQESGAATQAAVEARRSREDVESRVVQARRHLAELEQEATRHAEDDDEARRAQHRATRAEQLAQEAAERARRGLQTALGTPGG